MSDEKKTYDYEFSTFERVGDTYISYMRRGDEVRVYDGLKWHTIPAPATEDELLAKLKEMYKNR